jgi:hypothetical protein
MHRSGTSAVARLCHLLGVGLGPETTLIGPKQDNREGFWESAPLVALNDRILEAFHGAWDNVPVFPAQWWTSESVAVLVGEARALVADLYGEAPSWGWKDPRNCITLPFWQRLFPEIRVLIVCRNPVDTVASLRERNGFSTEKAYDLWWAYLTSALANTSGRPRFFVFYEELLAEPARIVAELSDFLGGSVPEAALEAASATVRRERCNHASLISDTLADASIPFPHRALYAAIGLRGSGWGVPDDDRILDAFAVHAEGAQRDLARSERTWFERTLNTLRDDTERARRSLEAHASALEARMLSVEADYRELEGEAERQRLALVKQFEKEREIYRVAQASDASRLAQLEGKLRAERGRSRLGHIKVAVLGRKPAP